MSSQLAFGASKSPSPPSPSPCQSPSPCESASASVPHLHLHHHLHLHVHHHLRLRLHLHRHPHRLISVLLLRLIHNTKRYDRCRVGGCPEGLAITYHIITYCFILLCKPPFIPPQAPRPFRRPLPATGGSPHLGFNSGGMSRVRGQKRSFWRS